MRRRFCAQSWNSRHLYTPIRCVDPYSFVKPSFVKVFSSTWSITCALPPSGLTISRKNVWPLWGTLSCSYSINTVLQTNERETCRHYILNSANVLTVTFSKWDSKAAKQVQSTHKLKIQLSSSTVLHSIHQQYLAMVFIFDTSILLAVKYQSQQYSYLNWGSNTIIRQLGYQIIPSMPGAAATWCRHLASSTKHNINYWFSTIGPTMWKHDVIQQPKGTQCISSSVIKGRPSLMYHTENLAKFIYLRYWAATRMSYNTTLKTWL